MTYRISDEKRKTIASATIFKPIRGTQLNFGQHELTYVSGNQKLGVFVRKLTDGIFGVSEMPISHVGEGKWRTVYRPADEKIVVDINGDYSDLIGGTRQ